jgi:Glycosyltransferase sugar-binding region containing DXD motif
MSAIPAHLHFVWIGAQLPWFTELAMQSALEHVPGARVSLWATHDLSRDPSALALRRNERFEVLPLDERTLFEDAPANLPLDLLAQLFRTLTQPAARSNIARLLVLARFGGVYLDTDTVTLRDLSPLYEVGGFCGLEHVVWPLVERHGIKPYRLIGGPLREVVRIACAFLPRGERTFARAASWYRTAANNAVLGFTAGHPFLLETLARVAELSPKERLLRYRLGTHLLQEMLMRAGERLEVKQLPPPYFYPLGPEVSRQYFRRRSDAADAARALVQPNTYVIHWYASVSELAPYDEARVLRERERTMFANIAARALKSAQFA